MDEKELLHYGIPGMKWGHRKSPDEIKRQRRDAKADNDEDEAHDDYKKTIAKKSLKSMSTKEIQEINTRIQAENQFKELNKTTWDRFKDKVKSVAAEIATNQAKSFVNHYADAGREKLQGLIDENTGLGAVLGLKDKAEYNRKSFDLNLKTTRENWNKAFGKKDETPKDDDKPKAPEAKKEPERKPEKEKSKTEKELEKAKKDAEKAKKEAEKAKANAKSEKEKRKAEEDKRKAEAKRKAEEVKRKAEEARRKAEEDKRKAEEEEESYGFHFSGGEKYKPTGDSYTVRDVPEAYKKRRKSYLALPGK